MPKARPRHPHPGAPQTPQRRTGHSRGTFRAHTVSGEVHVAIAPTAPFFAGVHLIAESIRRSAGILADAKIVATISADREPIDLVQALPWAREYDIDWRWVDPTAYAEHGLAATALHRFTYEFEAPFVLMLDADTLITGRLDELIEIADGGLAGLIAHVSPEPSFRPHDGDARRGPEFWAELFRRADLKMPPLGWEHTGWGLMDQDPGRRSCPPYFNLGVLAASTDAMTKLGDVIFDELATVDSWGATMFRCQLALTLALIRTGVPAREVPLRFNFPNDDRFWTGFPSEAADVRILHYLRRKEVDRDVFLADVPRLSIFLRRRSLSPANALLQARIGEYSPKLTASMHVNSLNGRPLLPRFPFARPAIPRPGAWARYLTPAYNQHRFSNRGPTVRRFERELTERCQVDDREAVVVASGTCGLVASLLALEVQGPVALPAFTFPATAHAIELAGCTPVFCDVDPTTWEVDPEHLAEVVGDRNCEAIIYVRSYGLCREPSRIEEVAEQSGVPLIVDSAAAFGGEDDRGRPVGGGGSAEVFSFHATKVFAVGEGGMVLAPTSLANKIRGVINFTLGAGGAMGRGLNGKMSEFTAAVGLGMLQQFDEHLATRRRLVRRLTRTALESTKLEAATQPGHPPWQCLPLMASGADARGAVAAGLTARGIETRPYYTPGLHRMPAFAGFAEAPLPVTDALSQRVICLPVYSEITSADATALDQGLAAVLAECGRRQA